MQAPLGTYMGWNLRAANFGEDDLCDNTGSFIPFAKTRAERLADTIRACRWRSATRPMTAMSPPWPASAKALVKQRLLLPEDAARTVAEAKASDVLR